MSKKTYRVYISLPITGYDEEERKEEAERLKNLAMENIAAGLIKVRPRNGRDVRLTPENSEVVTPFDIVPNVHGMSYAEIMGKDLVVLLECDMICFAKGWHLSKGCCIEFAVAKELRLKMGFE